MNLSENGLKFIQSHEGLRFKAYKDSVGIWTIGYGHIKDVHEDDVVTPDLAEIFLKQDTTEAVECVNTYIKVPLNQNQFDALVSFVFNLGCNALRFSTLLRLLNSEDYQNAAVQFLRWNKARVGGKLVELPGLTKRRQDESELFKTPTDPEAK